MHQSHQSPSGISERLVKQQALKTPKLRHSRAALNGQPRPDGDLGKIKGVTN